MTPFSTSPVVTERRRSQWNCKLFESPSQLSPNEPSDKTKLNLLLAVVKKENFNSISERQEASQTVCEAYEVGVI